MKAIGFVQWAVVGFAGLAAASGAAEPVAFKDAAKIRSWDAARGGGR